jgi:hypothetical protein
LRVPDDFLATIKKSDEDPMFVTVEIEAGWSRSKRKWSPEHLKTVVNKVNTDRMAGNLGHPLIDPKAHERDFPIPQVAWCAATMKGSNTAIFKGYVLKKAQARELLELGLIDGVSVFGNSQMKPVQGGYEVISFDPETIDFARKGRSGMKSRIVSLTGEQTNERGSAVDAKDVAALSEDELRTHAPLLVREIERKATEPFTEKVGEMETTIAGLQPEVDVLGEIKKLLKLEDGENPVEKLANFIERVEEGSKAEIKAFVNSLVEKKIKSTRGQALLRRMIGEMETQYDGPLTDDLRKQITDDFTAATEEKETKDLIGEMYVTDEEGTSEEGNRHGGHGGGANLGGQSQRGGSKGRNDSGANGVRRVGSVEIKSVSL